MNKSMWVVIYNEGQGFTEYKKIYSSLEEAIKKEGCEIAEARIYKNGERVK